MPAIPATQKAEIRRIVVPGSLGKKIVRPHSIYKLSIVVCNPRSEESTVGGALHLYLLIYYARGKKERP
jgi:hypothetical protein